MAYTPLRISVTDPCHEDWNTMSPVSGGTARHCDSCAKNVVDFTGFSDAQMHAYARKHGTDLCGRFRPDQLDRPLRASHKPSYTPLKVAAATAGLLLSSAAVEAQAVPEVMGEIAPVEILGDIKVSEPDTLLPTHTLDTVELIGYQIVGRMSSYHVVDTVPICTTPVQNKHPQPTSIDSLPLEITDSEPMIMGIMTPIDLPRPTGIDWIIDTLTRKPAPPVDLGLPAYLNEAVAYPNPHTGTFRLSLEAPRKETLVVRVIDSTGRVVLVRSWRVRPGANSLAVELPAGDAGQMHWIEITNQAGESVSKSVLRQ